MIVDPKNDGHARRRNSVLDNDNSHPTQPAIGFISEVRTMNSSPAMVSVDHDPSASLANQADRVFEQAGFRQKGHQKESDHLRQPPDWRPDRAESRQHRQVAYSSTGDPYHSREQSYLQHQHQLQQPPQRQEQRLQSWYPSSTEDPRSQLSSSLTRADNSCQRPSPEKDSLVHAGARPVGVRQPHQMSNSENEWSQLQSPSPAKIHASAWAFPAAGATGQSARYHPYHQSTAYSEHRQQEGCSPLGTSPGPAPPHRSQQQYQPSTVAVQKLLPSPRIPRQHLQQVQPHQQQQKQHRQQKQHQQQKQHHQQQQYQPIHQHDVYSHSQREHRHLVQYNQQELGRQQEDVGVHQWHSHPSTTQSIAASSTQRSIAEQHGSAFEYTSGAYRRPSAPKSTSYRENSNEIFAARSHAGSLQMNHQQPALPNMSSQAFSQPRLIDVAQSTSTSATPTAASISRVTTYLHPNHPLAAVDNRADATRADGGRHVRHSPSSSISVSISASATLHFDPHRTRVSWNEYDMGCNEDSTDTLHKPGFRSLPPLRDQDEHSSLESSSRTVADDRYRVLSDSRHITPAFNAHGTFSGSFPPLRTERVGMPALDTEDNGSKMKAGDYERGSPPQSTSRWSHLGPSTRRHSDGSIHRPRSALQGMALTKAPPAHDRRDSPQNLGYSTNNNQSTQPGQRPVRIGEEGYYGPQELEVLYRLWYPTVGRHQESRPSPYSSPMEKQERDSGEDDRAATLRRTNKEKQPVRSVWKDEKRNEEFNRATTDDSFNHDGRDEREPSLMDVNNENLDREDEEDNKDSEDNDEDDGEVDSSGAPLDRTQSRESGDSSESSAGCQADATNAGFALVGGSSNDAKVSAGADKGKSSSTTKPNRRIRVQESKNHRCKECGKKFSRPSQLQTHSFTHNGLKPHQCKTCKKYFNVASNLKRHIRTHATTKRKTSRSGSTVFRSFAHSLPVAAATGTSSGGKSKQRDDQRTEGQSNPPPSDSIENTAFAPALASFLSSHQSSKVALEPSETLRWMDTETPLTGSLMVAASHSRAQKSARRLSLATVDQVDRHRRGSEGGAIGQNQSFSSSSPNISLSSTLTLIPSTGSSDSASSTGASTASGNSTTLSNKSSSQSFDSVRPRRVAAYIPNTVSGSIQEPPASGPIPTKLRKGKDQDRDSAETVPPKSTVTP